MSFFLKMSIKSLWPWDLAMYAFIIAVLLKPFTLITLFEDRKKSERTSDYSFASR